MLKKFVYFFIKLEPIRGIKHAFFHEKKIFFAHKKQVKNKNISTFLRVPYLYFIIII